MASGACVKGTIFQNVIHEVREQRTRGRISQSDLEAGCKPADLEFLDQEVAIASWYPVDTYGRLLRVLCDCVGGGQREFLIESGRASARRVIEMGVYSQLGDHTQRWDQRVGRILVTLSGSFYNFGRWQWKRTEDGGFRIQVQDCAALPEEAALRALGFVEHLTCRAAGRDVRVEYERPERSQIVFRCSSPD